MVSGKETVDLSFGRMICRGGDGGGRRGGEGVVRGAEIRFGDGHGLGSRVVAGLTQRGTPLAVLEAGLAAGIARFEEGFEGIGFAHEEGEGFVAFAVVFEDGAEAEGFGIDLADDAGDVGDAEFAGASPAAVTGEDFASFGVGDGVDDEGFEDSGGLDALAECAGAGFRLAVDGQGEWRGGERLKGDWEDEVGGRGGFERGDHGERVNPGIVMKRSETRHPVTIAA
jgi:hypothetical protein